MKSLFNRSFTFSVFLVFFAAYSCGSASNFNKSASDKANKPDEIIQSLKIQKGEVIADLGSGGGYYALRFAKETGDSGKVYALDLNPEFLEYIQKDLKENKITNVETVLIKEDSVGLKDKSVDLVFNRNVFHHISNRVEYFKKLKSILKEKGRIAIIDYSGTSFWNHLWMRNHHTPQNTILKEMDEAGYKVSEKFDFLSNQSFTIFTSKDSK